MAITQFIKMYIGSYNDNKEADLSQQVVLESKNNIYLCTTLGGLLKMLSEKDGEIFLLTEALEEAGMRVCPICGNVYDEEDKKWSDCENTYVCEDCKKEEE